MVVVITPASVSARSTFGQSVCYVDVGHMRSALHRASVRVCESIASKAVWNDSSRLYAASA